MAEAEMSARKVAVDRCLLAYGIREPLYRHGNPLSARVRCDCLAGLLGLDLLVMNTLSIRCTFLDSNKLRVIQRF